MYMWVKYVSPILILYFLSFIALSIYIYPKLFYFFFFMFFMKNGGVMSMWYTHIIFFILAHMMWFYYNSLIFFSKNLPSNVNYIYFFIIIFLSLLLLMFLLLFYCSTFRHSRFYAEKERERSRLVITWWENIDWDFIHSSLESVKINFIFFHFPFHFKSIRFKDSKTKWLSFFSYNVIYKS